jgi:hypothetical protein
MKEWINRCHMTHEHARAKRNCKPTRLIKLAENEGDVAQLFSPETPVEFAALSYRWGLGKQSETTKENVCERFRELRTPDFPKTLQDAIQVTSALGLKYIWIDRVCIVQDDEEEWANEASLMADIYASAHVVLSATATEDCKDGFLQKRAEPLVIQYEHRGQKNCKVQARQIESHYCGGFTPKINYTLFKRGWCTQERLLARRIIHFLPDEILFECPDERECECGGASKEKIYLCCSPGFMSFTTMRNNSKWREQEWGWEWMQVVCSYSATTLTYGRDSLPAFSGLAAYVEHLKPGKYIAGIWEKDIAVQLGWRVRPGTDTRRWKYPEDVDILGPTFSWSSHVRPICSKTQLTTRILCTLESSRVELATSNPYGQVRHASLCLRGRIIPGDGLLSQLKRALGPAFYQSLYLDSGHWFNDAHHSTEPSHWVAADFEKLENAIIWKSAICFGLYEYGFYKYGCQRTYSVDVLLLQPNTAGVGEYVRVGLLYQAKKSWFDENAVAGTITIV